MKRRTMLRWTGTAGALAVAGCVGDSDDDSTDGQGDGSTPEPSPTPNPTEEPTESGEAGDSQEDDTAEEADSDPVDVVKTFVAAWQDGDIETFNSLIAESGNLDPVTEDQTDQLTENAPEIANISGSGRTGDGASVELSLLFPDAEEAMMSKFELTAADGEWRLSDFIRVGQERAPSIEFDTDWEGDTFTVTHASGDSVPADELFIRGEGIAETGAWHELSEELDADGTVSAGDAVTLTVEDEYSLTIVWDDGEYSATLQSSAGASNSESTSVSPVDDHLSETDNYDGTVADFTGQEQVTVTVGKAGDYEQFYVFDPPAIRVDAGTEVVWEWVGEVGHNVVEADGEFESNLQNEAGSEFSHTFEESGTYLYHCEPHEALGQKGAVVVE